MEERDSRWFAAQVNSSDDVNKQRVSGRKWDLDLSVGRAEHETTSQSVGKERGVDWMASSSRPSERGDTRWRVSFAADIGSRQLRFADGELLLRRKALRLVLRDARGETIDAKCLREGETLDIGDMVAFPCFFARIRERLPEIGAPVRAAVVAASGSMWGTVGGDGGPTGGAGAGPAPSSASMADGRHVGRDRTARVASDGSISPPIALRLDLEEAFSHFWAAQSRNPRLRESDSFGWWRGKVGGDPRSFAAVTVSSPSMGDGGRGFCGDRQGEPGRGAREPGPAPGRGGGRGGDWKFSWKRDDDNNNSSTSNVASGSDDTSRWDEAAMGKQAAEGGIWVPKSQGSSVSTGEGTDRQISTHVRRNQGPKANQVEVEASTQLENVQMTESAHSTAPSPRYLYPSLPMIR
ncbi:hypothetical protein ZWY2020_011976 [Hordeum vulgare]|nr:hypothetical protein ZWY2020_011976 [Hordeum vulgare]